MKRDRTEIIYLRVPVHIQYDCAEARAHVIKSLLGYDQPWKSVVGAGIAGSWAYETKWKPKLTRKPKRAKGKGK